MACLAWRKLSRPSTTALAKQATARSGKVEWFNLTMIARIWLDCDGKTTEVVHEHPEAGCSCNNKNHLYVYVHAFLNGLWRPESSHFPGLAHPFLLEDGIEVNLSIPHHC